MSDTKHTAEDPIPFPLKVVRGERGLYREPCGVTSRVIVEDGGNRRAVAQVYQGDGYRDQRAARIVACVNALAGVADPEAWVAERRTALPPQPDLSKVRELIDAAVVEIASTGAPFKDGKYNKNGEWSFAEMTEKGNPADAAAIKKGFLLLTEVLSILAAHGEAKP